MDDQSSFIFRVPEHYREVDQSAFDAVANPMREAGHHVDETAVDNHPCGDSAFVEIAIACVAVPIAEHYISKILDGFDALVKKAYDHLSITISINGKSVSANVPRQDKRLAEQILEDAFKDIAVIFTQPETTVFRLKNARIREDKIALLVTSGWQKSGGEWSKGICVAPDEQDYDFWNWLLNDPRNHRRMTDVEILEKRDQFCAVTDPTRYRRPDLRLDDYKLPSSKFGFVPLPP